MRHRLAVAGLMYVLLTGTSVAGEIVRVAINDLAFSPADVTAKVGDTIEWVNGDFVDHTATDKGGAWDVAIAAGKTGSAGADERRHVCLLLQISSWHDGEHPCRRKVTAWHTGTWIAFRRRARGRPWRSEVEAAFRTIIRWTGDNPDRDGLIETPQRMARAYEEYFKGYARGPRSDPVEDLRGDRGLR